MTAFIQFLLDFAWLNPSDEAESPSLETLPNICVCVYIKNLIRSKQKKKLWSGSVKGGKNLLYTRELHPYLPEFEVTQLTPLEATDGNWGGEMVEK